MEKTMLTLQEGSIAEAMRFVKNDDSDILIWIIDQYDVIARNEEGVYTGYDCGDVEFYQDEVIGRPNNDMTLAPGVVLIRANRNFTSFLLGVLGLHRVSDYGNDIVYDDGNVKVAWQSFNITGFNCIEFEPYLADIKREKGGVGVIGQSVSELVSTITTLYLYRRQYGLNN
jgi:hypothetical protein